MKLIIKFVLLACFNFSTIASADTEVHKGQAKSSISSVSVHQEPIITNEEEYKEAHNKRDSGSKSNAKQTSSKRTAPAMNNNKSIE